MRFARRLSGLALLVALGGGCDTTQPLQVQEQTLQLSFKAVNAQVKTFNVWDVFLDNDGNQMADGETFAWCQSVAPLPTSNNINPSTVPWHYSLEIKILRAGQTVAQTVTSPAALNLTCSPPVPGVRPSCNTTAYDAGASQPVVGSATKADICTVNGDVVSCPVGSAPPTGGNRYRFRRARRLSGSNQMLMGTPPSPLFLDIKDDVSPPLGLGQGLCSLGDQGPVNIDGVCLAKCGGAAPQPYELAIEKGDTVIVKARLAQQAPQGGSMNALLAGGGTPPNSLSAVMTLEGRQINLLGSSSGRSVSFSYTSR